MKYLVRHLVGRTRIPCVTLAYRGGHAAEAATLDLIRGGCSASQHLHAILAGMRPPVLTQASYITMGGPAEADRLRS